MNESESSRWRSLLREVLTEYNLHWVLEQVEQEIRLGRTSEKEIQTFSERQAGPITPTGSEFVTLSPTPAHSTGRKAKFLASRDYTQNEILEIVISTQSSGLSRIQRKWRQRS
jgi:hypothetical protein